MHSYILTYTVDEGTHTKIKAIKVVRMIFGISLKDAKDIIEGNGRFEGGVVVSKLQTYAIQGSYAQEFLSTDTLKAVHFEHFQFERIPEYTPRADFTSAVPIDTVPVFVRDVP